MKRTVDMSTRPLPSLSPIYDPSYNIVVLMMSPSPLTRGGRSSFWCLRTRSINLLRLPVVVETVFAKEVTAPILFFAHPRIRRLLRIPSLLRIPPLLRRPLLSIRLRVVLGRFPGRMVLNEVAHQRLIRQILSASDGMMKGNMIS
jgi:hypothetical protein